MDITLIMFNFEKKKSFLNSQSGKLKTQSCRFECAILNSCQDIMAFTLIYGAFQKSLTSGKQQWLEK